MAAVKYGLVHHPIPGESRSGDAYCVIDRDRFFLVAVVDGLGHGQEATVASQRAIAYIERHPEQTPQRLVEGCHEALKGTRGAVMAVARVERDRRMLQHAGLGNIETRVVTLDRVRRPVTVNGIVGHALRKLRTEEFPFEPGDLLIMHSDGISDRFDLSALARARDLQMLADQLVRENGRFNDDQLMLVVRDEP